MAATSLSCAQFQFEAVLHFMSWSTLQNLLRAVCVASLFSIGWTHAGATETGKATLQGGSNDADGWVEVAPEGATCWDGSPWHFWYRGGSAEKLAIWFEGGEACWNATLCAATARTPPTLAAHPPRLHGLFDANRADNPLHDFSVVLLPECTGDAHIGRRSVDYPRADGTLHFAHEGARNTLAALDWLKSRGFDPNTLFVSGAGDGAIGAAYWSVEVGDRWPAAQLITLGDSAGGYRSLGANTALRQWGVLDGLPDLPVYRDPERVYFESFYIAAAQRHPKARLGQVNFANDAVQRRFMSLLGTPTTRLTKPLTCNLNEVRIDAPGFHSFIYPGTRHVVLRTDAVYTTRCEGQSLVGWVSDLITGHPLENRWCDGTTQTLASPVANPATRSLTSSKKTPGL